MNRPTQYKLLKSRQKGRHFRTTLKIWLRTHYAIHVGRSAWEHNSENWVLYGQKEWRHSSKLHISFQWQMRGNIILCQWTPQSLSASYTPALMGKHVNTRLAQDKLWPWRTAAPHLAGCMPRQKTGLTQIVSWRALASSSLCTLPKLLGRLPCANLRENTSTQISDSVKERREDILF